MAKRVSTTNADTEATTEESTLSEALASLAITGDAPASELQELLSAVGMDRWWAPMQNASIDSLAGLTDDRLTDLGMDVTHRRKLLSALRTRNTASDGGTDPSKIQ